MYSFEDFGIFVLEIFFWHFLVHLAAKFDRLALSGEKDLSTVRGRQRDKQAARRRTVIYYASLTTDDLHA